MGFIVSMLFAAPEFITCMDEAAFTVWQVFCEFADSLTIQALSAKKI